MAPMPRVILHESLTSFCILEGSQHHGWTGNVEEEGGVP